MSKRIVILGGGIGGIVTANNLRSKLPPEHEIVLIERNKIHSFAASYLWLMVNLRSPEKITSPLEKLLDKNIKIIFEEVQEVDIDENIIHTENEAVSYDYLVIALGAELEKKSIENDRLFNFYTYEGAIKLRGALNKINSGEIVLVIESLPYKCPGAPYEAAMLISDFIKKSGKKEINVSLFSPEPYPLPVAGPQLGKSVADLLLQKGIKYYPQHQLKEIDSNKRNMTFNDGEIISYDLPVIIPRHNPPDVIRKSELIDESGWISVDRNILQTKLKNVYAIGDVNSISLPGKWSSDKPMKLPKAGVFAHAQALTVSEVISSEILGRNSDEKFCGDGFCMLEAGEDFAGFAYGDFFAEPHPDVKMKNLGITWHLGKVLFEKWWLSQSGFKKTFYKSLIQAGGKTLNIPIKL